MSANVTPLKDLGVADVRENVAYNDHVNSPPATADPAEIPGSGLHPDNEDFLNK